MAERVLCEMVTDKWTNITYPKPVNGNCFYTSDSKALQDFKKEVLTEQPELKGKLKIVTVKTMREASVKVDTEREKIPAYLEFKAYQLNGFTW